MPGPAEFDAVLRRMFERDGVDELAAHLADAHGVPVRKLSQLDVGVFRVDRADGEPPLVARLFSAARAHGEAEADLAVLRYLAEAGFRAERPFVGEPLSRHADQSVLLTQFVRTVPKAKRPPYPIIRLGAMAGHLHGMPAPAGVDRPAGALHHFAEGTMGDELRAVAGWLDSVQEAAPASARAGLDAMRSAVRGADGGDDLPQGFVHPDPVPKNVVFTAEGPVLVDWTSAGRGPRLPSLTLVLRSGWAAVPFMTGYLKRATLTDEERGRLAGLLFSRRLIDQGFRVCREPSSAPAAARKLPGLMRECEAQAAELGQL